MPTAHTATQAATHSARDEPVREAPPAAEPAAEPAAVLALKRPPPAGTVAAAAAPSAEPPVAASSPVVAPPGSGAWLARLPRVQPRSLLTLALSVVSLGSLLLFWHLAVKYRLDFYIRFNNIPAPADVWSDAKTLFTQPRFQTHVLLSLRRIFLGFAIAGVFGVTLGMLMGRSRVARELLFPALEVLRPIPAIAWVPMSIMLWPSNEVSIVFITFLGAFFPILLNTMQGAQEIDPVLVRAAQSLGASRRAMFLEVILPGALPQVFTGLALGMGVAWVSLIAAEMISGQFGIGYFTWEAYSLVRYSEIVLGMIVIGVLGLLCSGLIRLVGRAVMPWPRHGAH